MNAGRRLGLTGKQALQQLGEHYEAYRKPDGLLPITYEVIYGQAWQADLRVQQTVDAAGNIRIPISRLKNKR